MSSSNRRLEYIRPSTPRSWTPRVSLAACTLAFTSVGITSPTFARSAFDGEWSVVIETRGGACTPTLRYPIAITNGIVTNAGDTQAAVTGRVAPNGTVRVTVQSGGSWANGSGRLSATSGTGVWRGQGTSGLCVGTWQAQRRGAPIFNYGPEAARPYYRAYPGR